MAAQPPKGMLLHTLLCAYCAGRCCRLPHDRTHSPSTPPCSSSVAVRVASSSGSSSAVGSISSCPRYTPHVRLTGWQPSCRRRIAGAPPGCPLLAAAAAASLSALVTRPASSTVTACSCRLDSAASTASRQASCREPSGRAGRGRDETGDEDQGGACRRESRRESRRASPVLKEAMQACSMQEGRDSVLGGGCIWDSAPARRRARLPLGADAHAPARYPIRSGQAVSVAYCHGKGSRTTLDGCRWCVHAAGAGRARQTQGARAAASRRLVARAPSALPSFQKPCRNNTASQQPNPGSRRRQPAQPPAPHLRPARTRPRTPPRPRAQGRCTAAARRPRRRRQAGTSAAA